MSDIIRINVRTPLVDRSGNITREWFRAFEAMSVKANIIDGQIELTAGTLAGYMTVVLDGTTYKIPLHNAS